MKSLLALICMVAYVYCNSDIHKLPSVRELIGKGSQTCEDFISNLENAHCWSAFDPKLGFNRTFIYQINENQLPAALAEMACTAAGGHLLTIADATELEKIKGVIKRESGDTPVTYLLGAQRETPDKPFENTDKTDLTAFFRSLLPDPLDEGCTGIRATDDENEDEPNGEITNPPCGMPNRFICKFIFHKNSKVYISSHHDKSWFNAMEQCNMMGGNLATIDHPQESKLYNRLIAERNMHWAWIGLNDLNKERFFEWADHSTSRYRRFCHGRPKAGDMANDCVKLVARHHAHAALTGCMKPDMCFNPFPYICEIRSTACDEHTMTMQGYMTSILKDVYSARRVCRPCKRGPHHGNKQTQSKPKTEVIANPSKISHFLG